MRRYLGFFAVGFIALSMIVAPQSLGQDHELTADSFYHLSAELENQAGETISFSHNYGNPVLVTMFYGTCPHVCPMLLATIRRTEAELSADERNRLRVLAISIDPERDVPTLLKELTKRHGVDNERWALVRPKPSQVRAIAGLLGVRYRKLPDGDFNHTTKIVLLDGKGVKLAETSTLNQVDPEFLAALHKALTN